MNKTDKNPFDSIPTTIKTERLELRCLNVTKENAELLFTMFDGEKPKDYPFTAIAHDISKNNVLPESPQDMLKIMERDNGWLGNTGRIYYVFHESEPIGWTRIFYWKGSDTMQISQMFLVSKVWGRGFASEIYKTLDIIGFEKLGVNRITAQCDEKNIGSSKSIKKSHFTLNGVCPDGYMYEQPDGTKLFGNQEIWSKLKREYEQNGK